MGILPPWNSISTLSLRSTDSKLSGSTINGRRLSDRIPFGAPAEIADEGDAERLVVLPAQRGFGFVACGEVDVEAVARRVGHSLTMILAAASARD